MTVESSIVWRRRRCAVLAGGARPGRGDREVPIVQSCRRAGEAARRPSRLQVHPGAHRSSEAITDQAATVEEGGSRGRESRARCPPRQGAARTARGAIQELRERERRATEPVDTGPSTAAARSPAGRIEQQESRSARRRRRPAPARQQEDHQRDAQPAGRAKRVTAAVKPTAAAAGERGRSSRSPRPSAQG